MPKKHPFLGSTLFAVAAFLVVLGLGRRASSLPVRDFRAPRADPRIARSDDGALSMKLVSPGGPYLFGRQQIQVQITNPTADPVRTVDFFVDGELSRTATAPPFSVEHDFGNALNRHSILVLAQTGEGRAARLSLISRSADLQSRVEVDLVTVGVSVLDRGGRFVEGLSPSDFTLLEDGIPQTIVHFDTDPTPASVLVALDASESMQSAFWSVQKAANQFIASLPSFYQVGLLGIRDKATLEKDFTFDRRGLALAVGAMRTGGETALVDAVAAATTQLHSRGDRKLAVLFSDGGETVHPEGAAAEAALEAALRGAQEEGVIFYTIAYGPRASTALLRRIAAATGGEAFDAADPGKLDAIYSLIAETMNRQYALSYYPTRATADGGWRRVDVKARHGELTTRCRPGYLAGR